MAELKLTQKSDKNYYLSGNVFNVLNNRRSKMVLSSFNYKLEDDGIVIKSDLPIQELAKKIKLLVKFSGDTVLYEGDVDSAIDKFNKSEEEFNEFSHKAFDIKSNNVNKDDLKAFTDSLSSYMHNRKLYDLQLLSAYHLAFSQNGCNFSVPGAGKTTIVYGAYTYLRNLPFDNVKRIEKLLIIAPLSAFGPWEQEYYDCFGEIPNCKRISGSLPLYLKRQYFYGNTADITLVNYDSVSTLIEGLSYFLNNNKVMIVLDEAHKIKNTSGGVRATAVMSLAKFAKSRVVLTGTPAPNGYEDLYNLFHFIWPERDVIKYSIGQLRDMTQGNNADGVKRMIDNINPFFIRIRKSDLGLPEAIENEPIIVPMSKTQENIYRFIEAKFVKDLSEEKRNFHSELARARLIRLMQVATNPSLLKIPLSEFSDQENDFTSIEVEDEAIMSEALELWDNEIPTKFVKCGELVQEIVNRSEKVIIWVSFIGNILLLQKYLASLGIKSELLYGAIPVAEDGIDEEDERFVGTREDIIKRFHKDNSDFKVIIANPFAVAESISLHKCCHNAIYLERSFNCTHYLQSKDRIHRYGMPGGVNTNYYYILSKDSIDNVISTRLQEKEKRLYDIIENEPIPLFINATDEASDDIRAILDDYARRNNK